MASKFFGVTKCNKVKQWKWRGFFDLGSGIADWGLQGFANDK
jgi:hypothetical protein